MRLRSSALFLSILAFVCTCHAQQSTVLPAVVAGFSASGVSGIHLVGSAHAIAGSSNETGTFTYDIQADGTSRMQIAAGNLSRIEATSAFNEHPDWTWSGKDGVEHQTVGHNSLLSLDWVLPAFSIASRSASLATTVSGLTSSSIEFRRVPTTGTEKFRQDVANLSAVSISVDPVTSTVQSESFNIHPDNDATTNIPVQVRYSDYRLVGGVSLPFRIQKFFNGTLVLDLQVESATTR